MFVTLLTSQLCAPGARILANDHDAAEPLPAGSVLQSVGIEDVELTSNFWRRRLDAVHGTLLPIAFERTRVGVAQLTAARNKLLGKSDVAPVRTRPRDSDLYKVIEGAAHLLKMRDDPALEVKLDDLADLIAAAQKPDGYLYAPHIVGIESDTDMTGAGPYTYVFHSHELYNMGHLYEAAVAYYQATGKDKLLQSAEKSAQHINRVFFEGDPNYNDGKPVMQAPGHPEIELALVKLYQATGKPLYLDMARKFLEIRGVTFRPTGEGIHSATYAQQHAPVIDQREPTGHAVRAMYLYSAMADVAAMTEESEYQEALEHIWQNIVDTKSHITGGLGAIRGIEGFGHSYELPNEEAYDETCAAVGSILFNYRMFLLTKDAKYLDVAEVALLNNVLAGVNLRGDRFFYLNPLGSDGVTPFNHGTADRAEWFSTACCPTNLARILPQVAGMTYAHHRGQIYVAFYMGSKTEIELDSVQVVIDQQTNYPEDGSIRIHVTPTEQTRFQLLLRIPTWTTDRFVPGELYPYVAKSQDGAQLFVQGQEFPLEIDHGFTVIDRVWDRGENLVELHLPMPVRAVGCHRKVAANRGRIALTRGPFVLCAEGVDNGNNTRSTSFNGLSDMSSAEISFGYSGSETFLQILVPTSDAGKKLNTLLMTPYYAWSNRGVSPMVVWIKSNERP